MRGGLAKFERAHARSLEGTLFNGADVNVINVKCVVCLMRSNGENIAFGMRYVELPGGRP